MIQRIWKFGAIVFAVVVQFSYALGQDSSNIPVPVDTVGVAPLPAVTDTFSLLTARRTVASHLMYLQSDRYNVSLSGQVFAGDDLSPQQRKNLATQLKQIYDGESFHVEIDDIPDDPNYIDTLTQKAKFIVFEKYPELYVVKRGDDWKYSRTSANAIPIIHQQLFPFGADLLVNLFPKVGQKRFLGIRLWQIAGLVILFLMGLVLYRVLDWIVKMLIERILPRIFTEQYIDLSKVPPVAHPLSLLAATLILAQLVRVLLLGQYALGGYIDGGLRIASLVFVVVVLYRLVDLLADVFGRAASTTETRMDDQLVPLLSKIAKIIVVGLGTVFILQNLDINVMALLAGVSFIGLALAFAAQDTVKHFFGSIAIFVDRPFAIGDFIEAGGVTGTVVEVGVRSTRIQEMGGAMVTVPNGELAGETVTNHGNRSYRRYSTNLGLTYNTSPQHIEEFVAGVREIIFGHPQTTAESCRAYFHEMDSSSLNIDLAIVFNLTDYNEMLAVRQEILLSIMHLAEKLGVEFAFPTTSIYWENMPQAKE